MIRRGLAFGLFRHAVLLTGAAVMLAPFVWMVATSFKPPHEIFAGELALLPKQWHAAENYHQAYALLTQQLGKVGVQAGARAEIANTEFSLPTGASGDSTGPDNAIRLPSGRSRSTDNSGRSTVAAPALRSVIAA